MTFSRLATSLSIFAACWFTLTLAAAIGADHSLTTRHDPPVKGETPPCFSCALVISSPDHGDFELVKDFESTSEEYLECFYTGVSNPNLQTYCSYHPEDGSIYGNGNGFCPLEAEPIEGCVSDAQ
ncbi:hypothetical protein B0H34DRAFT_722088 [Crassisporium funariophilum]|nr:hypothetical protein B0H34DRAFT_722088 [Crassisporium funariophilum]